MAALATVTATVGSRSAIWSWISAKDVDVTLPAPLTEVDENLIERGISAKYESEGMHASLDQYTSLPEQPWCKTATIFDGFHLGRQVLEGKMR